MITDYHASYYAHELSRVGGTGVDRLGRALFDACVDLNPHQIEAALFALRSPLSKGVLLADEVGLGKTIEEQHGLQEEIVGLERKKRTLRERIFDIEDEIAEKRDRLVESLEKRMQQKTTVTPVFTIRWSVQ
jgi:hypothetical protein